VLTGRLVRCPTNVPGSFSPRNVGKSSRRKHTGELRACTARINWERRPADQPRR